MPENNTRLKKTLGVSHEGWPFAFYAFLISIALFFTLGKNTFYVTLPILFWVLWFFRDPDRIFIGGREDLVSPADGKIVAIEKVRMPGETFWCTRVGIFMNIFDVHVNRMPISGEVLNVNYQKGKFLNAADPFASSDNEQNQIKIQSKQGDIILVNQIAGLIARRIVYKVENTNLLEQGERFGLIRFGSRVDLYIPDGFHVNVLEGQKVKSGETLMATKGKK